MDKLYRMAVDRGNERKKEVKNDSKVLGLSKGRERVAIYM